MALYFGSNIENAYVGDAKVKRIYKGDTLVFETKPTSTYLISGSEFNKEIANVGAGDGTNVVFTNYKIPSDKISTATVVSTYDSEAKAYMYLDGDTIYVSPEEDNTTIYANENCSTMFYYYQFISSIDFSNFDTSKVTDMSYMFYNCKSLTSITGLENFNTSKVNDMGYMFYSCSRLSGEITIMNPNITSYFNMFYECSTDAGSKFTVNYKSGCQTVAKKMVSTKLSKSNVVLGVQV